MVRMHNDSYQHSTSHNKNCDIQKIRIYKSRKLSSCYLSEQELESGGRLHATAAAVLLTLLTRGCKARNAGFNIQKYTEEKKT